jgi:hypothetical protein
MNEEELVPLDELEALLETERAAPLPAAALERVWGRFDPASGGDASHARDPSWLASHALPATLAAFILGGAAGAGLHAKLGPPPRERVVTIYAPAPQPPVPVVAAAPTPVAQASEPLPSVPPVASGAPSTHAAAPAIDASSSLSAERELLDRTRAALTAEDPDRALSLLSDHARRFARPQLGEEREALAIQALANAGRYDEARERGARFRAAQPNSLFLPAVDATLASIP